VLDGRRIDDLPAGTLRPLRQRMQVVFQEAEVKDRGKLDHHDAANAIRQRHRYDVMALSKPVIETQERDDRDGSIREVCRFSPPVLEKFRELTGNTVKWGKKDRYWVFKPKARNA
jgi:hypothetical protein